MQTNLFEVNDDSSGIWSVSQLTREVKSLLETQLPPLWIKGEISNLRAQPSGHRYFVLKDSSSQIKSVLFKGDLKNSTYAPVEGDECLAYGNVTVYEPRGDYQFRIKHLMQDGAGVLKLKFEQLKEKLLKEGLFEKERKRDLPNFVQKIAIITSPRGAAIQDFLSILKRRNWRGEISIFPSIVQGKDAPNELIQCVKRVNSMNKYDLLIISRGGGSIEDLWSFNDEELVRELASCCVPVISAIGHQTDFVLTDFVADFRAETPSAAAEWITNKYSKQLDLLKNYNSNIEQITYNALVKIKEKAKHLSIRLNNNQPASKIESLVQYLDDLDLRNSRKIKDIIERNNLIIENLNKRLKSNNLSSILNRGFAYVKSSNGKIIDSAKSLNRDDQVNINFKDGQRNLIVN